MIPLPEYVYGRECGENEKVVPIESVRAYGDAVRAEAMEQAAMIVQENADACSGHVREILLANAAAIRSAPKDQS